MPERDRLTRIQPKKLDSRFQFSVYVEVFSGISLFIEKILLIFFGPVIIFGTAKPFYAKKLKFGEFGSVPKVLTKGYVKTREIWDRME